MNELKVDVDPAEVGLDAERLKRVDAHFAGYVDDGRLPGWLLTVTGTAAWRMSPGAGRVTWRRGCR